MNTAKSAIWQMAQALARIEFARELRGPRRSIELVELRAQVERLAGDVGPRHAGFADLVRGWLEIVEEEAGAAKADAQQTGASSDLGGPR